MRPSLSWEAPLTHLRFPCCPQCFSYRRVLISPTPLLSVPNLCQFSYSFFLLGLPSSPPSGPSPGDSRGGWDSREPSGAGRLILSLDSSKSVIVFQTISTPFHSAVRVTKLLCLDFFSGILQITALVFSQIPGAIAKLSKCFFFNNWLIRLCGSSVAVHGLSSCG